MKNMSGIFGGKVLGMDKSFSFNSENKNLDEKSIIQNAKKTFNFKDSFKGINEKNIINNPNKNDFIINKIKGNSFNFKSGIKGFDEKSIINKTKSNFSMGQLSIKKGPADIKKLIYGVKNIGQIRLNQQKGLPPFGDYDGDGVANILDCNPIDKRYQGAIHKIKNLVSGKGYKEDYEVPLKTPSGKLQPYGQKSSYEYENNMYTQQPNEPLETYGEDYQNVQNIEYTPTEEENMQTQQVEINSNVQPLEENNTVTNQDENTLNKIGNFIGGTKKTYKNFLVSSGIVEPKLVKEQKKLAREQMAELIKQKAAEEFKKATIRQAIKNKKEQIEASTKRKKTGVVKESLNTITSGLQAGTQNLYSGTNAVTPPGAADRIRQLMGINNQYNSTGLIGGYEEPAVIKIDDAVGKGELRKTYTPQPQQYQPPVQVQPVQYQQPQQYRPRQIPQGAVQSPYSKRPVQYVRGPYNKNRQAY